MTLKMIVPVLLATTLHLVATNVCADEVPLRLPNHVQSQVISGATRLGPVSPQDRLTLAVVLRVRDAEGLQQLIGRLSDPKDTAYGQYLGLSEFADRFAPSADEVALVADYFKSRGFDVDEVSANRLLVTVSAPVAVIERIFDVRLSDYRGPNGTFFANDRAPLLPAELRDLILTIQGLDDVHHRVPQSQPGTAPSATGLGPKEVAALHGLQSMAVPSNQTIAFLETGEVAMDDIERFRSAFELPKTLIETRPVNQGPIIDPAARLQATGDVEMALATAPGLGRILLYQGQSTDSGFLLLMNRAATDSLAKVVVSAWGIPEANLLDDCAGCNQILAAEGQILQEMAVQGQSFVTAAGNSGARDPSVILPRLSVYDPAAQPYATAIGGTQGRPDGIEVVWNDGQTLATGGGVSRYWPLPSYQEGGLSALTQEHRNVPDLALHADPETGYAIVDQGVWKKMGGTGSAAVVWGAITTRLNAAREARQLPPMGYMNPALSLLVLEKGPLSGFNDIVTGNNGEYAAGPGYDNVSGWGAPQVNLLAQGLINGATTLKSRAIKAQATDLPPLVVSASPATIPANSKTLLSVTGGVGTGAVTYTATTTTPGMKCQIRNKQNLWGKLSAGTCTVVATKAADGTYPAQTSAPLEVTVTLADQIKLVIASDPNPVPVGATTFLSVVGGSGTGKLRFSVVKRTGFAYCQIYTGILWSMGGAGSCFIQASKEGDRAYNPTTSRMLEIITN